MNLDSKKILALTVPAAFVLMLLGIAVRDRELDPTVAGGLIAILGSIVSGVFLLKKEDEDE